MAHAEPITKLTITGGTVTFNDALIEPLTPGALNDITVGDYDGGPQISSDSAETAIVNFPGIGPFTGIAIGFTSPNDDFNSGFPPPTGDITNGIATLDLASWTIWYNGATINQGANSICLIADNITIFETVCSSGPAVITHDTATGVFTADWSSIITNGSFRGVIGHWHLEGTMFTEPPCPLPADSGDINGDCKLDAADVLYIQRKVSGLQ